MGLEFQLVRLVFCLAGLNSDASLAGHGHAFHASDKPNKLVQFLKAVYWR